MCLKNICSYFTLSRRLYSYHNYYINNNDKLSTYFAKHKKKDDLADTLLQTVSYIKKNNNLVIEEVSISQNNLIENNLF